MSRKLEPGEALGELVVRIVYLVIGFVVGPLATYSILNALIRGELQPFSAGVPWYGILFVVLFIGAIVFGGWVAFLRGLTGRG